MTEIFLKKVPTPKDPAWDLWKYFYYEHDLILTESELADIIHRVEEYREKESNL